MRGLIDSGVTRLFKRVLPGGSIRWFTLTVLVRDSFYIVCKVVLP